MPLNLDLLPQILTSNFPKQDQPVAPTMGLGPAPTKQTPPARPFLDLPPEIRNSIYGYCIPVNGHTRDYQGFFLSCKRIKAEFEGEATKVLTKLLEQFSKKLCYAAPARTSMPTKFSEMAKVVFELPTSVFYSPRPVAGQSGASNYGSPRLDPAVALLLQLHLSELTITLYKNEPAPEQGYVVNLAPCSFVQDISMMLQPKSIPQEDKLLQFLMGHRIQAFPLGVDALNIGWLLDDFPDDINARRGEHFDHCHIMTDFAARDLVKSWTCNVGKCCMQFDFKGTGED